MEPHEIMMNRLYGDLAYLWPVMSPPAEYAEEAGMWREALRDALGPGRHEILELGVGGGHNLSHLAGDFTATAVDISEQMLVNSKRLNPGVEHIVGDMRWVRLGRRFKAVLVHDAISHMCSEADLAAVFATAAAHLEPGGVFLTGPDYYRETFVDPTVTQCTHIAGGISLTYLEYAWDPDPADTTIETLLTYVIREAGRVRIEHDRMLTGLFPRDTWVRLLEEAGFAVGSRREYLESAQMKYELLVSCYGLGDGELG